MKLSKLVAGAGLALTLAAFSPAAFAQATGNRTSSDYNSTTNTSSDYNSNATTNESPQRQAHQLKSQIDSAKRQGMDVSNARHDYKLGMRAMNSGDNATAVQHFQQAENDLSMQQNNQNGGASSSAGPSSGGWNNNAGGGANGNQ